MSMRTNIAVLTPLPPLRALDALTVIVGGDPATVERNTATDDEGNEHIANCTGQGLDAIVVVWHHPDGPLARAEDEPGPACCMEVGIETPSSEAETNVLIVERFGAWLDEQGARWLWQGHDDEWVDPSERVLSL